MSFYFSDAVIYEVGMIDFETSQLSLELSYEVKNRSAGNITLGYFS